MTRDGALHVKCAVGDASLLLLSSANLTHYALNLNMEMGILVRGGALPRRVAAHFMSLIDKGAIVRVMSTAHKDPHCDSALLLDG